MMKKEKIPHFTPLSTLLLDSHNLLIMEIQALACPALAWKGTEKMFSSPGERTRYFMVLLAREEHEKIFIFAHIKQNMLTCNADSTRCEKRLLLCCGDISDLEHVWERVCIYFKPLAHHKGPIQCICVLLLKEKDTSFGQRH